MRDFASLYQQLDASTATGDKVAALRRWFDHARAADAAWALYFLAGGKPRQVVPTALLRQTACRLAGIDDWLFEECYQAVGDLAETIAHVLPPATRASDDGLAFWVEQRLLPLRGLPAQVQTERLEAAFGELDAAGRFLLVKLIGGGFRVGVSKLLVQRALAEHAGLDVKLVAQRMMGFTEARATPSASRFEALRAPADAAAPATGQPYPFFLAHALQRPLAEFDGALGPSDDWLVEWKFDGIRAQVVKLAGHVWIWSRGEELVSDRFPEVQSAAGALPDGCILDGELLAWPPGQDQPAPFNLLQQRIARKTLTKKVLADAPVVFVAYDLLQLDAADLRAQPQQARRDALEALLAALPPSLPPSLPTSLQPCHALRLSPQVLAPDWAAFAALRAQSRARGVEGLMLKQRAARYGSGRTTSDGVWWKWKIDPLTVDGVLIYAQAGHGRRAGVYTDYTFAVWNRVPRSAEEAQAVVEAIARRAPPPDAASGALQLVTFAKAYSGLSDAEFARVDRVIRADTVDKFGPVRSVRPSLVFELGFEGINASPRHKSGIAVRFPRMLRIRQDKPLHEADTLDTLRALMA